MTDIDQEFRFAAMRVTMLIDLRAGAAVSRLYSMYAVGSGVCHCGSVLDGHPVWDNHAPVEMMRDKDHYDPDDTIPR